VSPSRSRTRGGGAERNEDQPPLRETERPRQTRGVARQEIEHRAVLAHVINGRADHGQDRHRSQQAPPAAVGEEDSAEEREEDRIGRDEQVIDRDRARHFRVFVRPQNARHRRAVTNQFQRQRRRMLPLGELAWRLEVAGNGECNRHREHCEARHALALMKTV